VKAKSKPASLSRRAFYFGEESAGWRGLEVHTTGLWCDQKTAKKELTGQHSPDPAAFHTDKVFRGRRTRTSRRHLRYDVRSTQVASRRFSESVVPRTCAEDDRITVTLRVAGGALRMVPWRVDPNKSK